MQSGRPRCPHGPRVNGMWHADSRSSQQPAEDDNVNFAYLQCQLFPSDCGIWRLDGVRQVEAAQLMAGYVAAEICARHTGTTPDCRDNRQVGHTPIEINKRGERS